MRVLVACEYSGVVRDAFAAKGHQAMSCDLLPTERAGLHYRGPVEDVLEGWMPVSFTKDCRLDGGSICRKTNSQVDDCQCVGPTQDGIEYITKNGVLFGRPKDRPHWDLMIAHPPCTYLCSSGLHWNKRKPERQQKTEEALEFVKLLMNAPIQKIAIENPIGCIGTRIRKADQIIQPYQFGEDASKSTCLWLKDLPKLKPTKLIAPRIIVGRYGFTTKRWGNQTDSGQNRLGPSEDRWKIRSATYRGIADAMADQWNFSIYYLNAK